MEPGWPALPLPPGRPGVMVQMQDGTKLVNLSPLPEVESDEEDQDLDEYDTMAFTLGRNLGGITPVGAFGHLSRNHVVLPHVLLRPFRCSTRWEHQRGVFNFVLAYYGWYALTFDWNVFCHSPPCEAAPRPGHMVLPYPDHPGQPMWVPGLDHWVLSSYQCSCRGCRW